jgi:pyrroloquinoline quinone (PQQ) biosynthesis protein C
MKADTDFVAALLAAARPGAIERNPFVRAVSEGTLSRKALKRYAVDMTALAKAFPKRLAAVLSLCDAGEVRRLLIGNLLEEEGVVAFVPSEGVQVREERRHGVMAEKFALAAGASPGELQATQPERSQWFDDAIRGGDWLGAFSYFAVGQEANVPATCRALIGPLTERYGIAAGDLEFLSEHFVADERHGIESAHLIARAATSDEARARALEGARRGGIAWWAFHRARATEQA